jgi:hypothetical protein
MALGEHLQLKLRKKYERSALITMKYKGNDISFKTDEEGNPILLFIGKATSEGKIKGERYARRLLTNKQGQVIKDHWELKGKAS